MNTESLFFFLLIDIYLKFLSHTASVSNRLTDSISLWPVLLYTSNQLKMSDKLIQNVSREAK